MAGRAVSITSVARTVGKIVTKLTASSAARTSARSASELSGRPVPLRVRTDSSPLTATARKSPNCAGLFQIPHMPDMKQIKATVGEDKSFPGATNFSGAPGKFRESNDLGIHAAEELAPILVASTPRSIQEFVRPALPCLTNGYTVWKTRTSGSENGSESSPPKRFSLLERSACQTRVLSSSGGHVHPSG